MNNKMREVGVLFSVVLRLKSEWCQALHKEIPEIETISDFTIFMPTITLKDGTKYEIMEYAGHLNITIGNKEELSDKVYRRIGSNIWWAMYGKRLDYHDDKIKVIRGGCNGL